MQDPSPAHLPAILLEVLSRDHACPVSCFLEEGISFHEMRDIPGRRRFPFRDPSLMLCSVGLGVVVTCSRGRMEWVRERLGELDRDSVFGAPTIALLDGYVGRDQQSMAGPHLGYVCTERSLRPYPAPDGFGVSVLTGEEVYGLYELPDFTPRLALQFNRESARPDVLAAVAERDGQVVGIAGVTADCEEIWQIGIEIRGGFQGLGLGKALVSRATAAVFDCGRLPYYSTDVANLRSSRAAIGVGYHPAATVLYAR